MPCCMLWRITDFLADCWHCVWKRFAWDSLQNHPLKAKDVKETMDRIIHEDRVNSSMCIKHTEQNDIWMADEWLTSLFFLCVSQAQMTDQNENKDLPKMTSNPKPDAKRWLPQELAHPSESDWVKSISTLCRYSVLRENFPLRRNLM